MRNVDFVIFAILIILGGTGTAMPQEVVISDNNGIESELSIAINPKNHSQLIVTSMRSGNPIQVLGSNDGGATWNPSAFVGGIADPVVTYGDNGTAYLTYLDFGATLEMYLAESSDNGLTWDSQLLVLDSLPADRQWIRRDNSPSSPYYGNVYLGYFHPSGARDIHIVAISPKGVVGVNHSVVTQSYPYVQNCALDVNNQGEIIICFLTQHSDDSFNIMAVASTDGSENFSSEVLVSPVYMYQANGTPVTDVVGFASGNSSRLQNSLQMAIDKSDGPNAGRVYLTWTDFVKGNPAEGMNIYLSYSDDNGSNWTVPKIVNDDQVPSSHQYFSGVTVNPNGVLVISWYDRRIDPVMDSITDFYATWSTDGGKTFATSIKLNSASADHNAVTTGATTFGVGEYTSVAASESHGFAIWADGRSNDGNMAVYLNRFELPAAVLKGDVNDDGDINLLDVAPFVDALNSGEFVASADINCDELVNLLDVVPFVELLSGN